MEITLRYFDGCPNWQTAHERLRAAMREAGVTQVSPLLGWVETEEDAERLHFIGSPTILVDGRDAFPTTEANFGLTCRIYETSEGLAGSPTVDHVGSSPRPAIRRGRAPLPRQLLTTAFDHKVVNQG